MTPNQPRKTICPDAPPSSDAGDSSRMASWRNVNSTTIARIDAGHEVGDSVDLPPADEPTPGVILAPDESAAEQISLQAAQLAEHLRRRQQEMDHREAALNSRAARLESDTRAARLWIEQRVAELSSGGEELSRERQELQRRLARLAAAEAAMQRRESPSGEDAEERKEPKEQAEELRRTAEALESRKNQLDAAGRRLAESQVEIQNLQEQLTAERLELAEQSAAFREQMAAERSQAMAELEEKRRAVERREEHADQCQAALKQLRGELERTHREALEIRLATEELWARLSGAAPPAALTRSIGNLRAKLAEQYAQAKCEQVERKQELEAVRRQILAEHDKLAQHKRQFERWVDGCREDCRQQASRLVAREQQLREEELRLRRQSQQWQAERLRMRSELERLQTQG